MDLGGGILSAVTALHNKNQCWLVDQSIFLTLFTWGCYYQFWQFLHPPWAATLGMHCNTVWSPGSAASSTALGEEIAGTLLTGRLSLSAPGHIVLSLGRACVVCHLKHSQKQALPFSVGFSTTFPAWEATHYTGGSCWARTSWVFPCCSGSLGATELKKTKNKNQDTTKLVINHLFQ